MTAEDVETAPPERIVLSDWFSTATSYARLLWCFEELTYIDASMVHEDLACGHGWLKHVHLVGGDRYALELVVGRERFGFYK